MLPPRAPLLALWRERCHPSAIRYGAGATAAHHRRNRAAGWRRAQSGRAINPLTLYAREERRATGEKWPSRLPPLDNVGILFSSSNLNIRRGQKEEGFSVNVAKACCDAARAPQAPAGVARSAAGGGGAGGGLIAKLNNLFMECCYTLSRCAYLRRRRQNVVAPPPARQGAGWRGEGGRDARVNVLRSSAPQQHCRK